MATEGRREKSTTETPSEEAKVLEEGQATTATAEADEDEKQDDKPEPLHQEVNIADAGPCKKHIKVSIPRTDIDQRLNKKFSEMMPESFVPGYRPGKAPRKLLEKRYYKEVSEQLRAELLLQSLE